MPYLRALFGKAITDPAIRGHGRTGDTQMKADNENSLIEYMMIDTVSESFYLRIDLNGKPYVQFGPFDTKDERRRVYEDLVQTMRDMGVKDVEAGMQ